jgi:hypothetical protein
MMNTRVFYVKSLGIAPGFRPPSKVRSTWGQQVAMFGKRAREMEKVKTKWKKARTERGKQKSEKV